MRIARELLPALLLALLPLAAPGADLRPAITGISHVTLRSADLNKSRHFYAGILGLHPVACPETGPGLCYSVNQRQYIKLVPAAADAPQDRLVEIGFETANANALRLYLQEHRIPVPPHLASSQGIRSFDVRDPEGHLLCFVQRESPLPHPAAAPIPVSTRIIHAGFIVRDRAREDAFYRDVLGFRVYWHGGEKDNETDWVDMQVPDGAAWLEYMLNVDPHPSAQDLGVMHHFALGVENIQNAVRRAKERGWNFPEQAEIGRDGKWQLNLYDPDLTRVEVMEFRPVRPPCCSPYTGPHPN